MESLEAADTVLDHSTASEQKRSAVFDVQDLRKSYGVTRALDGVSFSVHAGEFIALLGPNGAGKSTFIKVLDEVVTPDSGAIVLHPSAGGLGVVHQDLGLVNSMTVAENLFLDPNPFRPLHRQRERQATREILRTVGLERIPPSQLMRDLALAEQSLVAVAKLFSQGSKVIVVDELTAGLVPADAAWLVHHLRMLANEHATIIFVTHRLDEILDVADRFIVFMDGAVALDAPRGSITRRGLVDLMAAHNKPREAQPTLLVDSVKREPTKPSSKVAVARLVDACTARIGPVSLELVAGKAIGLMGVSSAEAHDIGYLIAGRLRPTSGGVELIERTTVACVPARRESEGVFPIESIEFNLTAGVWRRWRGRNGLLRPKQIAGAAASMFERLAIAAPGLATRVGHLSGGNQQKTVLGRALISSPSVMVLCDPTRGVDVATRAQIYSQVKLAMQDGLAVLVASSDVEDIRTLADVVGFVNGAGQIAKWVENTPDADLTPDFSAFERTSDQPTGVPGRGTEEWPI